MGSGGSVGVLSYQSNVRFVDFAYNSIPQDIKTTKYYSPQEVASNEEE